MMNNNSKKNITSKDASAKMMMTLSLLTYYYTIDLCRRIGMHASKLKKKVEEKKMKFSNTINSPNNY